MTTEIAVLNRLGVALATDSAVTISGGDRTKIFDTADKLFELSPIYPVAIMINGNMDFNGVPWEIVIKDFREQLGSINRDSIAEWMEAFLSYVETYKFRSINRERLQFSAKIEAVTTRIKNRVMREYLNRLMENPTPSTVKNFDFDKFIQESIKERVVSYEKSQRADSLSDLSDLEIFEKYGAEIDQKIRRKL